MTSEPDPALTGAAFDLANAGYTPMPDPDKKRDDEAIGGDSASLREAAGQRSGPPGEVITRGYIDRNGEPVPASEAITFDRAVRDYADATSADKLLMENESSQALAARVDAMRAEALANDPDAAERFGFELPDTEGEKADSEKRNPKRQRSNRQSRATARRMDLIPSLRRRCNTRWSPRPSSSGSMQQNKPGRATSMD